jgi:hypothetical protein
MKTLFVPTAMLFLFNGVLLVMLGGCAINANVNYKPLASDVSTSASVTLDVVDARDAKLLEGDNRRLGNIRNIYGMTFPVLASGTDRVTQLVRDATTDALRQAGVDTQEGSLHKLVATVKGLWVDGYAEYKSDCEVGYRLQDVNGKELWSSFVNGTYVAVRGGSTSFAEEFLSNVLADCAVRAAEQFKSPGFQKIIMDGQISSQAQQR